MIIAKQKRKSNLAEYILYMWQVEDMIRALDLDMDKINKTLVSNYQVNETEQKEISEWYENLLVMMQKEQKIKEGHLQFLVNLVNELNSFHLALLAQSIDSNYITTHTQLKSDIDFVREKSKLAHNDVEVALNSLYIILMLKMKKQEVSEGTHKAVFKFGNWLGQLSKLYKSFETGNLEMVF